MRGAEWPCSGMPLCAPRTYSASAESDTSSTAISSTSHSGRSSGSVANATTAPTNSSRYSPSLSPSRSTGPRCCACSALNAIASSVAANAISTARTGTVRNADRSKRENASATNMPTNPALSVVIVVGPA